MTDRRTACARDGGDGRRAPLGYRFAVGETTRRVDVWLPGVRPRAVLYLLDGQNVFDRPARARPSWRADTVVADLIDRRAIVPLAIVAVHARRGAKRWEEYLPYPDPHNASARRFRADHFADHVMPLVVREVHSLHPEIRRARDTAIGGSSYGGIAALHTALRHPDLFPWALLESLPLWVGDRRPITDAARVGGGRYWLGVGTAESRIAARSRELVRLHRELAARLGQRNAVRLRVIRGASHHESAWSARLPDALRWLFGA